LFITLHLQTEDSFCKLTYYSLVHVATLTTVAALINDSSVA